jgi:hypothetical protein
MGYVVVHVIGIRNFGSSCKPWKFSEIQLILIRNLRNVNFVHLRSWRIPFISISYFLQFHSFLFPIFSNFIHFLSSFREFHSCLFPLFYSFVHFSFQFSTISSARSFHSLISNLREWRFLQISNLQELQFVRTFPFARLAVLVNFGFAEGAIPADLEFASHIIQKQKSLSRSVHSFTQVHLIIPPRLLLRCLRFASP